MNVPSRLHVYREAGAIGRDEIAAAAMLVEMARRDGAAEPGLLAWLGMCLALRTVRDGHTCVDLTGIETWGGEIDAVASGGLEWPTLASAWIEQLGKAEALVGRPGDRKPFILDGHRLYLARALAEEEAIAEAIRSRAGSGTIRILLGGPGTGKTTKVAWDLVERFKMLGPDDARPRVALAAPTGKAAARMTEVLRKRCEDVAASADVLAAVTAEPARTVHKLLGYNPRRGDRFEYHAGNPLPYGLVIVDEASMLSSSLMHHLLAAVHPDSEIQLVGDPDQLASVDAGTVLGDIAACGDTTHEETPLHRRIERLTTIHRAESKHIIDLSRAIREGSAGSAFEILEARRGDVAWIDPDDATAVEAVLGEVTKHARGVRTAALQGDSQAVLEARADLQVLCGHRDGAMGVSGWNARIEKRLGIRAADSWYSGRPVMVTRNNPALGLSNGDVGVVVPRDGRREAVFGVPTQHFRVPVSRLEDIETVHALTIHKSQGSEYEHVVVVLPEKPSRIVTRELLYTGVTRAKGKVTLVGSRAVIEAAIKTPIRRATGLAGRLGASQSQRMGNPATAAS
jgi:exodeoxyribonuclease V alpha subunit